ncbi:MAG: hypothetical protein HN368_13725 [Spirochaetales bacterium]|jgi:hypothetical protein|nr:hypothetical protein [Spirochaetales bacterium]
MIEIRRNDPCPCGSGRKYKHCCYMDNERNARLLRAAARAQEREDIEKILNEPPRVYRMEVRLESLGPRRFDSTISRTIEIEGTDSLYDLHMEIQEGFDWDNDHLFSFFFSNRIWDKENEYSANPLGEHMPSSFGDISKPASETEIGDLLLQKGSDFKYLFDYGDEIVHGIEVVEIFENEEPDAIFPKLIQSVGEAPSQYEWQSFSE